MDVLLIIQKPKATFKKTFCLFISTIEAALRKIREKDTSKSLMARIRHNGAFKRGMEKPNHDHQRPSVKHNLISMGNVMNKKTRAVISEKAQIEQHWATTLLNKAPVELLKKVDSIVKPIHKHKRMVVSSSAHFNFDVQHQIRRGEVSFNETHCANQEVSQMTTHQVRFDDGIWHRFTLIPIILCHGSQFDADQLVNMLFPFSTNPEKEEHRFSLIKPGAKYSPYALKLLKFFYAMSRHLNRFLRDTTEPTNHIDMCQDKSLFHASSLNKTETAKG